MKNFYILFIFLFINLNGQITDLYQGQTNSFIDCKIYQNNLYFTSFHDSNVYKLDLSNNQISTICTLNGNPTSIYINGSNLFVGCSNQNITFKLDLLQTNPNPVSFVNFAGPMQIIGNIMYMGLYPENKIISIDLNNGNLINDVVSGYSPNYFSFFNGEIYFTSNKNYSLYKLNLTTKIVKLLVDTLPHPAGIVNDGKYLYLNESASNKIIKFDLNNLNQTGYFQLPTNSWPNGIDLVNNELYFIQTNLGRVSKISMQNLAINDLKNKKKVVNVYPNPTIDFINFDDNLNNLEYSIFSPNGILLKNSIVKENHIDISNFTKGIYFLHIKNESFKIIKK